ncbi:MAG: choice-of-anchor X domain-containing protein, partial [Lentisphaeria bacterium]
DEIKRQRACALLPQKATLYFPAYDVDAHYSGNYGCKPEKDVVYFNDEKLGTLNGDDGIWQLQKFSIPFDKINFPEAPGGAGFNELRIVVDIDNEESFWCTKIDWLALTFFAPRPVLMVHGWCSDGSAWNVMQKNLSEKFGIPSETIDLDGAGSIQKNGYMIAEFLNYSCSYGSMGMKWFYGAKSFNIMAHSKGGLDARFYVSGHGMRAKNIRYVMQIATPNGGCYLADCFYKNNGLTWKEQLIYDLGAVGIKISKATFSLCQENMAAFNVRHPLTKSNAVINVLAGQITEVLDSLSLLEKSRLKVFQNLGSTSYHYDPDRTPIWDLSKNGDGIVSVKSAHALNNAVPESPLLSPYANHIDIKEKLAERCLDCYKEQLCEVVKPGYTGKKEAASDDLVNTERYGENVSQDVRGEQPNEEVEWSASDNGENGTLFAKNIFVAPAERKRVFFSITEDQNLVLTIMQATRSLGLELVTPSGSVITPMNHPDYFLYSEDAAEEGEVFDIGIFGMDSHFVQIDIPKALSGEYQLTLDGKELAESKIYYFFTKDETDSWKIEARLQKKNVLREEPFVIESRVMDAGNVLKCSDYSISCQVRKCNSFEEECTAVVLADQGSGVDKIAGDGVYTGAVMATQGGFYDFFLTATKKGLRGVSAERSLALMGSWSGNNAAISSLEEEYVDENENGLYDILRVRGKITVEEAGEYCVDAELFADNDTSIVQEVCSLTCDSAGTWDVSFDFSGETIFEKRISGPYLFRNVKISQRSGSLLMTLLESDLELETQAKSYLEFEHQPLYFLQTGTENMIDEDHDGYYDRIEIITNLLVADGYDSYYTWSANLLAEDDTVVGNAYNSGYLSETMDINSPESIALTFSCDQIEAGHYRGPFKIQMVTLENQYTRSVTAYACNYETKAYSPFDFVKDVNIVDVTDQVKMLNESSTINYATGALKMNFLLKNVNQPTDKALDLVFRLALPSDSKNRLGRIDGKTESGVEYMDVTSEVEEQLLKTGNMDYKFDQGEEVVIQADVFSNDRSIPEIQLYSFWADPPAEESTLPKNYFLDENNDMQISDWEILRGVDLWYNQRLNDENLLQLIHFWQSGGYQRNEEKQCFESKE